MEDLNEIFWTAMMYLMDEAPQQRIKQIYLAKLSGVSASYLNDIRKRRNPGSDDAHRRIAAALGFPGRKYEDFLDVGRSLLAGHVGGRPEYPPNELEGDADQAEECGPVPAEDGASDDDRFFAQPAEYRHFYHALNYMLPSRDRRDAAEQLAQKAMIKAAVIIEFLEQRNSPLPPLAARKKIAAAFDMTLDGFISVGKRIDEEVTLQTLNFYPKTVIQMPQQDDPETEGRGIYERILNPMPGKYSGLETGSRPLPMLGLAYCGYEGWKTVMPISVSASPISLGARSFAVIIDGLSMRPEGLGPGMICYCDPDQAPLSGDAVYIGASRAEGGSLGSIKQYLGAGAEVGLPDGWLQVRGWRDPDNLNHQQSYVINIPPQQIVIVATVIYVRRRV
jgi:hypothetical protein